MLVMICAQAKRCMALAALLGIALMPVEAQTQKELSAIARDAYIFTLPLHELHRIRYLTNVLPANPRRVPVNRLLHRRELSDHTSRAVTTPNNDTLYSSAFLDLSDGGVALEVPEIADRYYSFALMDFYSNNVAYVGTRTTGTGAGKYLIVGPGWKNAPPAGTRLVTSPTNAAWLLGRILAADASDLPRVHALQNAVKLTPLHPASAPMVADPPSSPNDPLGYFALVNRLLAENPPPERDAAALAEMASINLGPGRSFDPGAFDELQRKAIVAGVEEAKRLIAAKDVNRKAANGWAYPDQAIGNFGTDYLLRATTASKLLAALEPVEATYLGYVGEALDGSKSYRLRFGRDDLPPVNAFWSLSIYEIMPDQRMFFAENQIGRYAISDRTPNLHRGEDGSLEIYIQRERPTGIVANNWLPAPAGPFALILRAYLPRQPLIDGTYAPPRVEPR
jgi:hypothetical protein